MKFLNILVCIIIKHNEHFIEMINDIDFLYGFIYEYADLVNNL